MYQPPLFREQRPDVLQALIRTHPLGMVISTGPDGDAEANLIPLLLDEKQGEQGVLRGHLARANPQWKMLAEKARVLVVFQGPEAYVTPSWYASKRETGKVVPTWNYAMVQVRGTVTVHDDPEWLGRQIRELTQSRENSRAEPWAVEDAPDSFIAAQIRGIVGIEIAITSIEGKWKVSQNRSVEDRIGVADGLQSEGAAAQDMAGLVRDYGGLE